MTLSADLRWEAACALALSGVFWILWFKGYTVIARQLTAGLAAVIFPALAALIGADAAARPAPDQGSDPPGTQWRAVCGDVLRRAIGSFVGALFVTLSGAMLVALLLDDIRFYLKLEAFRGVKAAYVLPLAIVVAAKARAWTRSSLSDADPDRTMGGRLTAWLSHPVKRWHVLLGVGLLGLLAVYVLRSGNQGLPLFGLEVSLRAFLEETLPARPRTKEFLIGHPALIAAYAIIAYAGRMRTAPSAQRSLVPLLMLGAIGPVSVVNTFAHAHSPLALSLWRTAYGALLGSFVGTLAACLLIWAMHAFPGVLAPARSPHASSPEAQERGVT